MKQRFDWEAAFIAALGITVFVLLSIGAAQGIFQ